MGRDDTVRAVARLLSRRYANPQACRWSGRLPLGLILVYLCDRVEVIDAWDEEQTMTKLKLAMAAGIAAVLAFGVAACGQSPTGTDATADSATTDSAAPASTDAAPDSAAAPAADAASTTAPADSSTTTTTTPPSN
jgi:hypothetical protein